MTNSRPRARYAAALCLLAAVLVLLPSPALSAAVRLRVTAEVANLRLKPDIGSAVIRQFPRGTLLQSTAKEGDWYLVSAVTDTGQTETGYVHESLVAPLVPEEQERPAEQPAVETRVQPSSPPPEQKPVLRPTPVQGRSRESVFSLTLMGGAGLVLGGDLNRGAKGLAGFFQDSLNADTVDEVGSVGLGYAAGGEVLFPLADRISLGLGIDLLRSARRSLVNFIGSGDRYAFSAEPAVWDLPIRAFLDFAPAPFIHLKIGLEYHFAHASYFYRWETSQDWQEWTGEADARALGIYGGLCLEWPLARAFSLVLDLSGRYAPLTGFTGVGTYLDSEGASAEEEGSLYYYETRLPGESAYILLFIRSRKPSEGGVYNPRSAEVDFTGFSLKAGFKVAF